MRSTPHATTKSSENDNEILSNQTNFFDDELMEQSPPSLPVEHDPLAEQKAVARKKQKKLFILLGMAAGTVLSIGAALMVVLAPVVDRTPVVIPSPIVISNTQQESSLSKRLDELEDDLRDADPIELEAPFPPVNFDLSLD